MAPTLTPDELAPIFARLDLALEGLQRRYPGAVRARSPVHVVYGGAHLFDRGTMSKVARLGREALDRYACDAETFGECIGLAPKFRAIVFERVVEKLESGEPVEDYRIDFEDGYGWRSNDEEDEHAKKAEIGRAHV